MPDRIQTSSGQSAAHAGESYLLSVAFPAWISAFGPRPNFKIDSKQSREWLEWVDEGRHHGLAAFQVDAEGLVSKEPIKAIPRRKPWQSVRQWGGR